MPLESPNQPEVLALIADLDAYQDTLYPPEARYALDLASLMQPNVAFAVARDAQGRAVACGAVVMAGSDGELKRMYVQPASRGRGVADDVLACVETAARSGGCRTLWLETGPHQTAALSFYARHGFTPCGPFGDYPDHPLSVFMHKAL